MATLLTSVPVSIKIFTNSYKISGISKNGSGEFQIVLKEKGDISSQESLIFVTMENSPTEQSLRSALGSFRTYLDNKERDSLEGKVSFTVDSSNIRRVNFSLNTITDPGALRFRRAS